VRTGIAWRRVVVARTKCRKRDVYYYPVPNTDERLNAMLTVAAGGRKLRSARDVVRLRALMCQAGRDDVPDVGAFSFSDRRK
jgi:hypothetical protein